MQDTRSFSFKERVNVSSVVFSTQVCYPVEKDVIRMDAKTFGAFLAQVRREQGLTQAGQL